MESSSTLKVEKTSRSSIDSLANSKEEYKALIAKIDSEVTNLSQQIRIADNNSNVGTVERLNKLKLHRRKLQEMLSAMETIQEESWESIRTDAIQIFKEASSAYQ